MIRVLVVEDEAASRELLVGYLRELPGVAVVGEASDGQEGLRQALRLAPHGFLRVHRQALVRLEAVQALTGQGDVLLPSGAVPCSRRLRSILEAALEI